MEVFTVVHFGRVLVLATLFFAPSRFFPCIGRVSGVELCILGSVQSRDRCYVSYEVRPPFVDCGEENEHALINSPRCCVLSISIHAIVFSRATSIKSAKGDSLLSSPVPWRSSHHSNRKSGVTITNLRSRPINKRKVFNFFINQSTSTFPPARCPHSVILAGRRKECLETAAGQEAGGDARRQGMPREIHQEDPAPSERARAAAAAGKSERSTWLSLVPKHGHRLLCKRAHGRYQGRRLP